MLKTVKTLDHFKRNNNLYTSQAIIGENDGHDEWPVKIRVWKEPHEKTWRWSYKSGQLLTPKNGVAYEPMSDCGEGLASASAARKELIEKLEIAFA